MRDGTDPAMLAARAAFEQSGLTLEGLGVRMGYAPGVARKSAAQFLTRTADPRLHMLRRFAAAVGVPVEELVRDVPADRPRGDSPPPAARVVSSG